MVQFALHFVTALIFAGVAIAMLALIAWQLHAARAAVAAALTGRIPMAAPRPWSSRVRLVSRSQPTLRLAKQLRATA